MLDSQIVIVNFLHKDISKPTSSFSPTFLQIYDQHVLSHCITP